MYSELQNLKLFMQYFMCEMKKIILIEMHENVPMSGYDQFLRLIYHGVI